mmetsp:Transcript_20587/g.63655  ORF Transcript_20587/g.63655 Transcript_20587/m.63655 type:complete len:259 (-) Transcript_20587:73-849(-)
MSIPSGGGGGSLRRRGWSSSSLFFLSSSSPSPLFCCARIVLVSSFVSASRSSRSSRSSNRSGPILTMRSSFSRLVSWPASLEPSSSACLVTWSPSFSASRPKLLENLSKSLRNLSNPDFKASAGLSCGRSRRRYGRPSSAAPSSSGDLNFPSSAPSTYNSMGNARRLCAGSVAYSDPGNFAASFANFSAPSSPYSTHTDPDARTSSGSSSPELRDRGFDAYCGGDNDTLRLFIKVCCCWNVVECVPGVIVTTKPRTKG